MLRRASHAKRRRLRSPGEAGSDQTICGHSRVEPRATGPDGDGLRAGVLPSPALTHANMTDERLDPYNAPVTSIQTCPCCGLAQHLPPIEPHTRACCIRCGTTLKRRSSVARSNSRTAAVALAALILYPLAVSLPMIRVERFGHHNDASILEGGWRLL